MNVVGEADRYLDTTTRILDHIRATQGAAIESAAGLCANAIIERGLVHTFGSGHSRIIVEEFWPRYGSFPGFHPVVELSLTAYHQVVGANGLLQAMFIENTSGLAATIFETLDLGPNDVLVAISSSGASVVTVELAQLVAEAGCAVIAVTSMAHAQASKSQRPDRLHLHELATVVLDTCTPAGDAGVHLAGLDYPVGPTTTVAGTAIANAVKVRIAQLLIDAGVKPAVLPSAVLVGAEESTAAFKLAMAEHARRISRR